MAIDDNKPNGEPLSKQLGLDLSKIKSSETVVKLGAREGFDIPVGLTPQGKPTRFGESQYDVPFTTAQAITSDEYKYYRGERQSALDKWANGLVRFVGKTPARIAEGIINPFLGTASALANQDASKLWDNGLTNGVRDFGNFLDEELPLYMTRDAENAHGLEKLAYANTWAGDILDGISYSVSAIASGQTHVKLLGALAKSATLGKTGEFINKLYSIDNAADKINYINTVDNVFKKQIVDGVKKGTFALMGATTESADNALSDSKEWYAKMEEQLTTDEYGRKVRDLSDNEKAWLSNNAKQLGNTSFAINLPIIMADNWLTFGKAMFGKGAEKMALSEVADMVEQGAEGTFKAAKKNFIQKALDNTYGIRKVAGRAVPEALQEQLQYGITKGTEDFYTKRYYNPNAADFIESMQVGLTNAFATKEGWDQALIGGIVGGLTGNVTTLKTEGLKGYKSPTDDLVNNAIELLNNNKTKDAYKAAMDNIMRHANLTEEQVAAAKANDDFEYQNKQSDLFLNYVLSRIKTGKTESLISDLNDLKGLSAEEFENTYDTKLSTDKITGLKQSMADYVQKKLDKINKVETLNNALENIVPNAPSNLKDRLLYAAFSLDDAKERAITLSNEVKDIVRQGSHSIASIAEKNALATDYTQLTTPEAKQAYKESILNSTLSPIDQQVIISKLNDYDKLRNREQQFVTEYKNLLDPRVQEDLLAKDAEAEAIVNDLKNQSDESLTDEEASQPLVDELFKAYSQESTNDLKERLSGLNDPDLATNKEVAKHIDVISKILKDRETKTTGVKEDTKEPVNTTGTQMYTDEELAELDEEDYEDVPEVGTDDGDILLKVKNLQKDLEEGKITPEEFQEAIKDLGKPTTKVTISPEQDLVSNAMVNEYIDTAELTNDADVNKQESVSNTPADNKSLAKMSNVGMMRLFDHTYNVIKGTTIKLFRWVRGADGKVIKTDSAISSSVNSPAVAAKGSKIIYRTVELSEEAKKLNDENIAKSRNTISNIRKNSPFKGANKFGYTEEDAKFEGDVYTATIGMFTEDGTLVGYYQLPHALQVTDSTSMDDIDNYIKVRQQILAERKLILDTIAYGYEASTEVLDKGYGNLLTQVVDNKPVMQGNLFDAIRPDDKFNGQPIFIFEGAKGFEIKGSDEIKKAYSKLVASIPAFNKPGRLYQVVKAANGSLSIIPVYTNLINDATADNIIKALKNLDEAPSFNEIISALNPFIYAGNAEQRPNVSLNVKGDGAQTKFVIGGQTYTLAEIQANSNRLTDFKEALKKKRHNIEVNNINNKAYQKQLADNNALSTNAYTEDGQYFVQPLIVVKPVVGEVTKVTPVKEKVTEVRPTTTPTTDALKTDLQKAEQLKMEWGNIIAPKSREVSEMLRSVYDFLNTNFNWGLTDFRFSKSKNALIFSIGDKTFSVEAQIGKMANAPYISNSLEEIVNAKYDAELAALEGAKPKAPVSDAKADIEKTMYGTISGSRPLSEMIKDGIYIDLGNNMFAYVGKEGIAAIVNKDIIDNKGYYKASKSFWNTKEKRWVLPNLANLKDDAKVFKVDEKTYIDKFQKATDKLNAELAALEGKPSEKEPIISGPSEETKAELVISTKSEVTDNPDLAAAKEKLNKQAKNKYQINPEDLDDLSDDAFSRPRDKAEKPLDTKDVKKVQAFIRKYVPFLTLSDIREVSKVKGAMIDSVGMLRGTIMYLFNGAKVKTAYHEAFHGVFRNMLTKEEQQAILDEVKAKQGQATAEQIAFQKEAIPAYYKAILSEEELNKFAENKHYEESLADEFMEVADTEINKPWYKKIADFFKSIFNLFNIFNKTTFSQSEQLFNNILAGKYAKGKPVVLNTDINKYNAIPAYSRSEKIGRLNPLTQIQRVNSIAAEFTKEYTSELKKGKSLSIAEQNALVTKIFSNIRNKYEQILITEMAKDKPNLNIALVAETIVDNFDAFVKEAKAVMRTSYKIKLTDTGMEVLKNQLDSEEQGQDVENTETEETGMTKEYGQEFINIAGIKSASTRLKLALSFVPKRDTNGNVIKDFYGFDQYYNHEQVYYWLERNLVGITDMNEMLDTIKQASAFKPELGDVYNMLTEVKEGNSIEEHEMFRNEFRSNFAKQQMVFVLVTFDRDGNSVNYKIIDSNRQGLGREIFDRWVNNVKNNTNTIAEIGEDGIPVIYGTAKAKALKTEYQESMNKMTPIQMREFLAKLGITFSDGVVEKVFDSERKEEFVKEVIPVLDWYASDDPGVEQVSGRKALGNLVKFELNGNINGYTSSFNNVENRAVYTIQNPTYASKTLATIKGNRAKFDAYYNERIQDPFFKYSNLLDSLNSDDQFRQEQFKIFYLNGLKDHKGNTTGAKWTNMSSSDKLSMNIELFDNKKDKIQGVKTKPTAYYSNITESDKTLHTIIQSKKYTVKILPVMVNGKLRTTINPESEIVDKFYNVALNEAGRIKQAIEFRDKYLATEEGSEERKNLDSKLLEYYHFTGKDKIAFNGQAFKFMQIDGLNKLLQPITEQISNNPNLDILQVLKPLETEIKQAIADDLTKLYETTVREALNNNVIKIVDNKFVSVSLDVNPINAEGNKVPFKDAAEEDFLIKKALTSFSSNEYLNNIEYSALINGDLAFYKPGDGPKRFYQGNSMTRTWNTNVINEINFSIVADHEVPTDKESMDFLKSKLGKDMPKAYSEDVNATDATVFVSPELWANIKKAEGVWDANVQKAYNIGQGIEQADYANNTWQDQLTVIKPFIVGQQWDEELGVMIPRQVKCTFVPLFKNFTKSSPVLADLAYRMEETGIDAVATRSAMKAAMNINDEFLTTNLDFNNTLKIKFSDAGTQVDNPDHLVDSQSSSNRQQKMLIPGVIDPNHNYSGRAGIDVRNEINEIESTNVQESLQNLNKAYHTKEFNEYTAEALNSRNANINQRDVLHVNEDGTYNYPLDFINSRGTENMISSIFTKRVVKQDFKGGSAVQVTGLGYKFNSDYKTIGDIQKIVDSNDKLKKLQSDLKWIRQSKDANKIEYVDAVMPAWSKKFFKQDKDGNTIPIKASELPGDILSMVIQRIPNEGPHSNMVIRVKEFLAPEFGNMIILPYEVTKILGSDFDFDKVYFHAPEFTVSKDGKFKKIKYIDGDGKAAVEQRYKYYVNSVVNKEESKETFQEFIDVYERYSGETIESLSKNEQIQALVEVGKLLTLDEFSKLSIARQNTKQARNNRLLDNYDLILRDIHHLKDVATPSGFENIEAVFNKVKAPANLLNFYTGTSQRYYANLFHSIIGLKGLSAVHVTGHAYASLMNLKPKVTVITKNKTTDKDGVKLDSLSSRTSINNTLIVKDMSSMMAAILDAVKKPDLLPSLGINDKSIDIWATIVRLGAGVENASLYTASPAIKDLTTALMANKFQIKPMDFEWQNADKIIAKYQNKLDAALEQLTNEFDFKADRFVNSSLYKALQENKNYVIFTTDEMLADINYENSKSTKESKYDSEYEVYYLARQIRLLQAFNSLKPTMDFIKSLNTLFAMNKEVGPDIENIIDKKYLVNELMDNNSVEGFNMAAIPQLASIYNAHTDALEKLNEEFPYDSPQYLTIKNLVARAQARSTESSTDFLSIKAENRAKINGFIKAYIDSKSTAFEDTTSPEEKQKLLNKVPLKLAEIQKPTNDKKEGYFNGALRRNTFIENLEIKRITDNQSLFTISLRGNRFTSDMQDQMIKAFEVLYNHKDTKEFAIDLIKHSFVTTGLYSGLNSYSHLIPVSIFNELGTEKTGVQADNFVNYRLNTTAALTSNRFVLNNVNMTNLIDQLVRNFPKVFTQTYNNDLFLGFEDSNKPETITVIESKLKESRRDNTFIVGTTTDENEKTVNIYQQYIRVYSPKYGGSLLYKNINNGYSDQYKLINYLGKSGKLIEIDSKGPITESLIASNNYKIIQNTNEQVDVQTYTGQGPIQVYAGKGPIQTYTGKAPIQTYTGKAPIQVYTGKANQYGITEDDLNEIEESNDEVDTPTTISSTKSEAADSMDITSFGLTAEDLDDLTSGYEQALGGNVSFNELKDDADDLPDDIEPGDCTKKTKK